MPRGGILKCPNCGWRKPKKKKKPGPKPVGIQKASAKLNDEKVREIRNKYESGMSFSALAKEGSK